MAQQESGGVPDMIGVNIEPFIPAMTEEPNSDNSTTHDPDGQRVPPEPPEADHRTYYTANGGNPSGGQASNPSQRIEETMDDLRNRFFEA